MNIDGFDGHILLQSLGGDEDLAGELLTAYYEDAPDRLRTLEEALLNNDADLAMRSAHSLKGMSGVVRLENIQAMALKLELAANNNNLNIVRELFPEFKSTLESALTAIGGYLYR